jgi:hypothetical protein
MVKQDAISPTPKRSQERKCVWFSFISSSQSPSLTNSRSEKKSTRGGRKPENESLPHTHTHMGKERRREGGRRKVAVYDRGKNPDDQPCEYCIATGDQSPMMQ